MNLEDQRDQDQAVTVPCPYCGSEVGEDCIRKVDGYPLTNLPAHTGRLKAAGVVHAPLDPRELRG